MLFWPFGKFDFEIWVEEEGNFPTFLGWFWARVNNVGHGAKWGQKLKSAPKTECQNRMKSYRVMPMEIQPKLGGSCFVLSRVLSRGCDVITLFHLRNNSH